VFDLVLFVILTLDTVKRRVKYAQKAFREVYTTQFEKL
jgi:hypothetical protein